MWFSSWSAKWQRFSFNGQKQTSRRRRLTSRPVAALEALERRELLTAFTALTAAELIADIKAANQAGGSNIITLAPPDPGTGPYILSAVNNNTNGANGLPVIGMQKAVNLTIVNQDSTFPGTIERNAAAGTPAFRLFDVAGGSSLTLENVTLQNGLAQGSGAAADGGAIYNQGGLNLNFATLQDNAAVGANGADGLIAQKAPKNRLNGQAGGDAAGGAIWSSGSVKLDAGTLLQQNQAVGGQGGAGGSTPAAVGIGGAGGNAFGGGLYEAGGSVVTNHVGLEDNAASGGIGGDGGKDLAFAGYGGNAYGGGIVIAGGTATLNVTDLASNVATGGTGGYGFERSTGNGGNAFGGGLYVGGGASTLTNDTVTGNEALGGSPGGTDLPVVPVDGEAYGGGIEIAAAATVSLDSSTLNNTSNNYIGGVDSLVFPLEISNIDGTYTLLP